MTMTSRRRRRWWRHDDGGDDDVMTTVVTMTSWRRWWWTWWWWNNKHTWYLLCARHCSKYFIDMNSSNPYNNSVRWVLLSLFTDKETESQRQQGTHSRARTHSGSESDRIWEWKDLNPGSRLQSHVTLISLSLPGHSRQASVIMYRDSYLNVVWTSPRLSYPLLPGAFLSLWSQHLLLSEQVQCTSDQNGLSQIIIRDTIYSFKS